MCFSLSGKPGVTTRSIFHFAADDSEGQHSRLPQLAQLFGVYRLNGIASGVRCPVGAIPTQIQAQGRASAEACPGHGQSIVWVAPPCSRGNAYPPCRGLDKLDQAETAALTDSDAPLSPAPTPLNSNTASNVNALKPILAFITSNVLSPSPRSPPLQATKITVFSGG